MPEPLGHRIISQPDNEPADQAANLGVDHQVEGVEYADPDVLAEARNAVEADEIIPEVPEEERVAPGYGEYVQKAWKYIRSFWQEEAPTTPTISTKSTEPEKVYTQDQLVQRQQRRELFISVDEICDTLITAEPANVEELIGQEIKVRTNTYKILRLLGQGGMGITLIAENTQEPGKEYVMKLGHSFDRSAMHRDPKELVDIHTKPTILQRLFGQNNPQVRQYKWKDKDVADIAEARRQIVETASLYKLSHEGPKHRLIERNATDPIFPKLVDAQFMPHPDNREHRLSVTVMEKIEGRSLRDEIPENEGMTNVDQVVDFSAQLLRGVEYMHAAGVLHLDLKPDNIIVTPEQHLAFVDFGLADLSNRQDNDDQIDVDESAATEDSEGDSIGIVSFENDAIIPNDVDDNQITGGGDSNSLPVLPLDTQENSATVKPRPVYARQVPGIVERVGTKSYYVVGQSVAPERDDFAAGRIMHDMVYGRKPSNYNDTRLQKFPTLAPKLQVISRAAEGMVQLNRTHRKPLVEAKKQMEQELIQLAV